MTLLLIVGWSGCSEIKYGRGRRSSGGSAPHVRIDNPIVEVKRKIAAQAFIIPMIEGVERRRCQLEFAIWVMKNFMEAAGRR
jgi:hypothetical protein